MLMNTLYACISIQICKNIHVSLCIYTYVCMHIYIFRKHIFYIETYSSCTYMIHIRDFTGAAQYDAAQRRQHEDHEDAGEAEGGRRGQGRTRKKSKQFS